MSNVASSASDWLTLAPWKSRSLLLIHRAGNGSIRQAWNVDDKRALLAERAGVLLAVWPGEFSTSARQIAPSERKAVLEVIA